MTRILSNNCQLLNAIFRHESAIFAFALLRLKNAFRKASTKPPHEGGMVWQYDLTGQNAVFAVLIFVAALETAALSILLAPVSPVLVLTLHALNTYGLIWLAGDLAAIKCSGVRFARGNLLIEYGLAFRASFPMEHVEAVHATGPLVEEDVTPCFPVTSSPNLEIRTKVPVRVFHRFQNHSQTKAFAIRLQDAQSFISQFTPAKRLEQDG